MKTWKLLFLIFVVTLFACSDGKNAAASGASAAPAQPVEVSDLPPDPSPPPSFNANRAMQYLKEIVALGPRPIGSANHKKVENYILAHLKGDDVEQDSFDIHPTEGTFPVRACPRRTHQCPDLSPPSRKCRVKDTW